jgi:AraC-like DNA-binding protein
LEEVFYMLELTYQMTNIPVRYIDKKSDFILFARGYAPTEDPLVCDSLFAQSIMNLLAADRAPIIEYEDEIFLYGAYQISLDCCIILGPISQIKTDPEQVRDYARQHAVFSDHFYIKKRSFDELFSAMSLIYFKHTGKYLAKTEVTCHNQHTDQQESVQENEYRFFMLDNAEHDESQISFTNELIFMQQIIDGDIESIVNNYKQTDISAMEERIVRLAHKSIKQYEYAVCASITLATRAAIKGGIDPLTAYSIGALYFQRLERCEKILDMYDLQKNAILGFAEQVNKTKMERSKLSYIEQCRSFIINHLNKPFSLEDVAQEIGINKSYLSRRFSEVEGIGIKKFTQNKRLETAANMLKYSNESISTIANYLCFPSQSQFGVVFKQLFGLTPQKYRDKEQVNEISKI